MSTTFPPADAILLREHGEMDLPVPPMAQGDDGRNSGGLRTHECNGTPLSNGQRRHAVWAHTSCIALSSSSLGGVACLWAWGFGFGGWGAGSAGGLGFGGWGAGSAGGFGCQGFPKLVAG